MVSLKGLFELFGETDAECFGQIPFSKDCGSDKVCVSDLVLKVNKGREIPR